MDKPAILSNPETFVVVPVEPVSGYRRVLPGYSFEHYEFEQPDYQNPSIGDWEPLYARPNPTALSDIAAYCAELEEYARLLETGVAYWSGEPEGVTSLQLVFKERREQKSRIAGLEAENERLRASARTVYEWMNSLPIPTPGCTGKMKTLYNAAGGWKEKANA